MQDIDIIERTPQPKKEIQIQQILGCHDLKHNFGSWLFSVYCPCHAFGQSSINHLLKLRSQAMKALDSSGEFSFRMLWKGYTSEI
jgi:hypothetical protein